MTEIEEREVYLVPAVGTVVTLQNAAEVAQALADVRDLANQLYEARRILSDALVRESERRGSRSFEAGRTKVEVRRTTEIVWDTEKLEQGLLAAGCPQELLDEIITQEVSYKVSATRASRAATANPAYAEVIKASRQDIEKNPTVVLSKP